MFMGSYITIYVMEPISTMHISTDYEVDMVRGSQSLTKLHFLSISIQAPFPQVYFPGFAVSGLKLKNFNSIYSHITQTIYRVTCIYHIVLSLYPISALSNHNASIQYLNERILQQNISIEETNIPPPTSFRPHVVNVKLTCSLSW